VPGPWRLKSETIRIAREAGVPGSFGLFVEQRQPQQIGMAFIHMKFGMTSA
jgi:hypothetical protein